MEWMFKGKLFIWEVLMTTAGKQENQRKEVESEYSCVVAELLHQETEVAVAFLQVSESH